MKKYIIVGVMLLSVFSGCATGLPSGGESEDVAIKTAQCIKEKGTKMYGAFWCPHCADQKRIFGKKAEAEIPYYECDPRGENSVTDECLELKIEKYPTWFFPDGTRVIGVFSLAELAQKSGCEIPASQ